MTVDGEDRGDGGYDGRRLPLTGLGAGTHEVVVDARLPYVTDGDGMHTMTDPADGERYVGAYCGMDIAQKIFACFDQNDLKAPIALTVTRRPGLDRARQRRHARGRRTVGGGSPRRRRIPPALFVVAAGPWASYRWEHAGLPFGWHARASLAAELDRDVDELRAITEGCFDHFARAVRGALPVRLLRPGLRARPQLGRPGDAGLRDLPRRVPSRAAPCPRTCGCSAPP